MLEVGNLSVRFTRYGEGWSRRSLEPITGLDLTAEAGEVVAVVGESGAGKSLLAHALLGLLPRNAEITGTMRFKGRELTPGVLERLRGREIALIPQSVGFLDPLMRIGRQVERAARLSGLGAGEAGPAADQALSRYGLSLLVKRLFPYQVSGGMARRVLTAAATAGRASLILADEPTTGLDPVILKETLRHLRDLADAGKAVVLITHDLEAALRIADRVVVFCAGTTVEAARPEDFRKEGPRGAGPRHPYTRALWRALPGVEFEANGLRPSRDVVGCPFHPTCREAVERCAAEFPPLAAVGNGLARCFNA
ncbi:MAG: ABC transporter ATP-binding protein [Pseudomonadota bacterium]